MWVNDLMVALRELFDIYDFSATIEKIQDNLIYMSDNTVWRFNEKGIERWS